MSKIDTPTRRLSTGTNIQTDGKEANRQKQTDQKQKKKNRHLANSCSLLSCFHRRYHCRINEGKVKVRKKDAEKRDGEQKDIVCDLAAICRIGGEGRTRGAEGREERCERER